ncbi:MAG: hypothetical protein EBS55_13270 [Flavobacteriaceae bacterium]|nr:hypothetical protein [Flavobacteriaceae bacterium]
MNLQENIQRILKIIKEDESSSITSTGGWTITYKNPMAIIQNPPDQWEGLKGDVNGKLQFKEMKYGVRAGVKNLKNSYFGKGSTPTSLIKLFKKYAPAGHGSNDPTNYATFVANKIGVKTTDQLTWDQYGKQIARAIINMETGIPVGGEKNKVLGVTEDEFITGFDLANG